MRGAGIVEVGERSHGTLGVRAPWFLFAAPAPSGRPTLPLATLPPPAITAAPSGRPKGGTAMADGFGYGNVSKSPAMLSAERRQILADVWLLKGNRVKGVAVVEGAVVV